jgi:hypothetical protein
MLLDEAMDADRLDDAQAATGNILYGACCRYPPTRRDGVITFFGGSNTIPLALFSTIKL